MRSFRNLASLSILSIVVAASTVAAQPRSRFELGTFLGYTFFDNAEPFDDAAGGGAIIGLYIFPRLSLEADASFTTTQNPAGEHIVHLPIRARLQYTQPLIGGLEFMAGMGFVQNTYLRDVDGADYGASGLVGFRHPVTGSIDFRLDAVADRIPESIVLAEDGTWHYGLRAGVGVRLGPELARGSTSGAFDRDSWAAPDSDRDGVADAADECPDTGSGARVDDRGCPLAGEAVLDGDGDGVANAGDACPGTPAGRAVDERGCPAPDGDGDGVADAKDECPITSRGSQVDARGCAVGGTPPRDADLDDVPDAEDDCPGTLAGVDVDNRGCPLQPDSDGDGVDDGDDACPKTPPGRRVDGRGCSIPLDTDADGVPDGDDDCPDTSAGVEVDARGCSRPTDADGDGVADAGDACPDTPSGAAVDARGCPASPGSDDDGDGVSNAKDRCPRTPVGEGVDATGCRILFDGGSTKEILEGVDFVSYDSYELTSQARQILDGVARWLTAYPGARIEIASHTHNRENRQLALIRSLGRASAVRRYLVSQGVDGSRVQAKGYGPDEPIADNATAAGRARNDRIELRRRD